MPTPARRPLKTRGTAWAGALARALVRAHVAPNTISVASMLFAALGAALLLGAATAGPGARGGLFVLAAVCVQLRLLANMLDGMVAVEGGLGGPDGPVFNELPDRIADPLLIVPAGYACGHAWSVELAWTAGLLALLTAYIRCQCAALGVDEDFRGPMAKPHRMAALTLGLLLAAALIPAGWDGQVLMLTLLVLVLGTAWTAARRARRLIATLRAGPRA
jgi:phosphatidylglycerophosphate synthase